MEFKKSRRTRKFLGKTEGFVNKEERNFEKAHLKAYLKGKRIFKHHQKEHKVQQELSIVN